MCLRDSAPGKESVEEDAGGRVEKWERGLLTSPLLAVRFCRAPAQASKVASFLLLPMRFR